MSADDVHTESAVIKRGKASSSGCCLLDFLWGFCHPHASAQVVKCSDAPQLHLPEAVQKWLIVPSLLNSISVFSHLLFGVACLNFLHRLSFFNRSKGRKLFCFCSLNCSEARKIKENVNRFFFLSIIKVLAAPPVDYNPIQKHLMKATVSPHAEIIQTWVHLKAQGIFAGVWSLAANQTGSMNIYEYPRTNSNSIFPRHRVFISCKLYHQSSRVKAINTWPISGCVSSIYTKQKLMTANNWNEPLTFWWFSNLLGCTIVGRNVQK